MLTDNNVSSGEFPNSSLMSKPSDFHSNPQKTTSDSEYDLEGQKRSEKLANRYIIWWPEILGVLFAFNVGIDGQSYGDSIHQNISYRYNGLIRIAKLLEKAIYFRLYRTIYLITLFTI